MLSGHWIWGPIQLSPGLSQPVSAMLWVCLFVSLPLALPPGGGGGWVLGLCSRSVLSLCTFLWCVLCLSPILLSEWTLHSCCVFLGLSLAAPELSQSLSFLFLSCPWTVVPAPCPAHSAWDGAPSQPLLLKTSACSSLSLKKQLVLAAS